MKPSCLPLIALLFQPFTLGATTCLGFPKTTYQDAQTFFLRVQRELLLPTDDKHALEMHTLILQGFDSESAASICAHIDCDIKELVNTPIGRMRLRPAHFAAMVGDIHALAWLHEHGANLDAKDAADFTAAHFAALRPTRHSLDFLIGLNVESNSLNKWGASPEQLWHLTHLTEPARQRIYYFDPFAGKPIFIDGDTYCILTGTSFVEGIKQRPLATLEMWFKNDIIQENPFAPTSFKGLTSFRNGPWKLYLKSDRTLTFSNALTLNDYRLYSATRFDYGDIIDVYAGEWMPSGVDTSTFRGFLSFVSNGLPNMVLVPFKNKFGLKDGNLAVAIRAISANDVITWDRASVEARFEISKEAKPEALDAFLEAHSLERLLVEFRGFESQELSSLRSLAVLHYIARHVSVFVRLIAEQKICVHKMRRIAKVMNLSISSKDHPDAPIVNILDIVLSVMEETFKTSIVRDFFAQKAREGNVQILLLALQNMRGRSIEASSDLERLWQDTIASFCRFSGNAKKPACLASSLTAE